MLQALEVTTNTGTVLNGRRFHSPQATAAVILITGVEGNIYNNPFYTTIGKTLEGQGIDLIVAHTKDAFNSTTMMNRQTRQPETYGAFNEDFTVSDDDVAAYVTFAEQHYQKIILGGQSLGANKVIHYLSTHPQAPITRFLLMSPVNIDVMRGSIPQWQRDKISEMVQNGAAAQRLPFKLFRWLSATATTGQRWLSDDTLNNVHPDRDGDFSQIASIQHRGALLIGTRDHFTGGQPRQYLLTINDHFQSPDENQVIYIANAGHIYRQHEDEVATKVLTTVERWLNR